MLATAASLVKVYNELLKTGIPRHTHIVSVISAQPGLDFLQKEIPGDELTIWTFAIDPELNTHGYIVPGLGDAGDLAFGLK